MAALLGALVGCGGDDPDDASDTPSTAGSSTTSTEPEPSDTETNEPATSEPTGPDETTNTTRPPQPTGLAGALLPAADVPGLNAELRWQQKTTSRRESDPPPWVCQQASLITDGAVTSRQRTYVASGGGATAAQSVARTVDARSAKRVYGALLGNARDCAEELAERGRKPMGQVRPLTPVDVPAGQAAWGVLFSGPVKGDPDAAHIDGVVVVRVGDLVSVLSMSSIGQDYNYEPGQTPPELAAPLIADALAAVG